MYHLYPKPNHNLYNNNMKERETDVMHNLELFHYIILLYQQCMYHVHPYMDSTMVPPPFLLQTNVLLYN